MMVATSCGAAHVCGVCSCRVVIACDEMQAAWACKQVQHATTRARLYRPVSRAVQCAQCMPVHEWRSTCI